MVQDAWSVTSMLSYQSRTREEIDVLWSADLPLDRDVNPAVSCVVFYCANPVLWRVF